MDYRLAYRFIALERTDGKAPDRVLLMRDGNLGWMGFEEMALDAASVQHVLTHFAEAGNDLPIDYHHATVKEETGKADKAPAAGWVKSLEYVKGEGLYARVTWTEQATKEIETEAYKYLSPVVLSNDDDEILRLHSVALTNRPRTKDQIELLKAAELLVAATCQGDSIMATTKKLKTVAAQDVEEPAPLPAVDETQALLGNLIAAMQEAGLTIADEAPLAEVLTVAIEAVKGAEVVEAPVEEVAADAATPATPVAGTPAEVTTPTPAAALPCKAAESAEVCALRVKAARLEDVSERLKVLEDERKASRVNELVEAEIARGAINPNNANLVAGARGLAEADEARFKAVFAAMDPIVEPGRQVSPTASDKKESQKTDRAKLIAAAMEEFDTTGVAASGAKKRHYVDVKLEDAGEPDLNKAEIEQLEKVGV